MHIIRPKRAMTSAHLFIFFIYFFFFCKVHSVAVSGDRVLVGNQPPHLFFFFFLCIYKQTIVRLLCPLERGEHFFFLFYFVDCSNVISAYQRENCGGGDEETGHRESKRAKSLNWKKKNAKFNAPLFFFKCFPFACICVQTKPTIHVVSSSPCCPCLSSSSLG